MKNIHKVLWICNKNNFVWIHIQKDLRSRIFSKKLLLFNDSLLLCQTLWWQLFTLNKTNIDKATKPFVINLLI